MFVENKYLVWPDYTDFITLRWVAPNSFLQLRRYLRSLDGSTNSGGLPKCFTLPHVL